MIRRLIKRGANLIGYDITRVNQVAWQTDLNQTFGYDLEREANESIKRIIHHTMSPYTKLVTLYQQAVHCEKNQIPGDFVECGVWKGGAVALMALANLKHGKRRRHLHLFDSFDDICEPDENLDGKQALNDVKLYSGDDSKMKGELRPLKGFYDSFGGCGTLDENRNLLENIVEYDPAYIHYHVGWFQDTVPKAAAEINEIAILRLDGDWYASMKVCLESLYPKLVSKGFLIIDDYGYYEGSKKAVDEFIEQNQIHLFMNHVDSSCRYLIKQ